GATRFVHGRVPLLRLQRCVRVGPCRVDGQSRPHGARSKDSDHRKSPLDDIVYARELNLVVLGLPSNRGIPQFTTPWRASRDEDRLVADEVMPALDESSLLVGSERGAVMAAIDLDPVPRGIARLLGAEVDDH